MKKNIYYLANTKPNPQEGGIAYKIYKQLKIFNKNGLSTHFICIKNKTNFLEKVMASLPLGSFKLGLDNLDSIENYSDIYIRYFFSDYKLIKKLRIIKQRSPKSKIAIEIPTFPYDGENMLLKTRPAYWQDVIWRKQLYKYVDKIVTFSDDDYIFNIPTIKISNGVDTNKIHMRIPSSQNNDVINMLAVAKFGFWHGYDRMIEGIHRYYTGNGKKRKIVFYIVGYGDKKVESQYQEMIEKYNLEDKVKLVGKKEGKDLDYYYNLCDIAIDSMGRHRSKVYYNSSLKGKEYLAKGLPIVSGVKTELDSMPNFKYYFRVPADDTPVNIEQLIHFFDSVYANQNKSKIVANIRSFCVNNFDITKCFEKVVKWYVD